MASGLIVTYLGEGLLSARPATPNIGTGVIAIWYSTDTTMLSAYVDGAWKNVMPHVGTTAPSSPAIGDLWVDTN